MLNYEVISRAINDTAQLRSDADAQKLFCGDGERWEIAVKVTEYFIREVYAAQREQAAARDFLEVDVIADDKEELRVSAHKC